MLGERTVAEYVLDDAFKPHFQSLRTPSGHETVLVSPGDHRHHKGMMYALRCEDLNFWEETTGDGGGVQRAISTAATPGGDGLQQELRWSRADGALETYRETRVIRARHDPARRAIVFSWSTRRQALRDHRLIKSEWSLPLADGRRINYHGLGVRLPWMWRFPNPAFGGVEENGEAVDPAEACGGTARSVGFWGLVDGQWERTVAALTVHQPQDQAFTWFVLRGDFPYLSLGPTNSDELEVRRGQIHQEQFQIVVEDRPSGFGL